MVEFNLYVLSNTVDLMLTPLPLGHFSPQKGGGELVKIGGGELSMPYNFFMKIICSIGILINITKCDLEVQSFLDINGGLSLQSRSSAEFS